MAPTNWPRKKDTSAGFAPPYAPGADVVFPGREALRQDGLLDPSALGPGIHRFLLDWARLRNVHGSTRMEGNPLSLDEAHRILASRHATQPHEKEVLRLSTAYQRVHDADRLPPLTVDSIVGLHGELFEGILESEDRPGQLKSMANGVADARTGIWVFEATPPERTGAELESLLAWYSERALLGDPVVAAGLFFVEFQAIHPFHDGNGRIGRLLNHRLLRAAGFRNVTLTAFDGIIFRRSAKYYEALRATNRGRNYQVWLRFYADTLRRAYREAARRGDVRELLSGMRSMSERDLLVWALSSGIGWFRRSDFPNRTGYAPITVTSSLASLRERGILERQGVRSATRYRLAERFLESAFSNETIDFGEKRTRRPAKA